MKKHTLKKLGGGFTVGIINGMFGAGGGIIAVPLLRKFGMNDKESHASSVAVILPLSVFSAVLYILDGRVKLSEGLPYVLPGLIGAVLGTLFLSKISPKWLHAIFGALIIYAGIRLMTK